MNKMRPLTMEGLCSYLKIGPSTWGVYKKTEVLSAIVIRVIAVMHAYNVDGAAADLMNASIIIRKESLKERTDHSSDDRSMSPVGDFNSLYDDKTEA